VSLRVSYHRGCQPQLAAWRDTLPVPAGERREVARVQLDAVAEVLARFDGRPPDAVPEPGLDPAAYWWRFYPGWWMRYVVRAEGRWPFRRRRVIVLRVQPGPSAPPPG
jgi:hypothetical protein